MKCYIQVCPQLFYGNKVWTLAWPLMVIQSPEATLVLSELFNFECLRRYLSYEIFLIQFSIVFHPVALTDKMNFNKVHLFSLEKIEPIYSAAHHPCN